MKMGMLKNVKEEEYNFGGGIGSSEKLISTLKSKIKKVAFAFLEEFQNNKIKGVTVYEENVYNEKVISKAYDNEIINIETLIFGDDEFSATLY